MEKVCSLDKNITACILDNTMIDGRCYTLSYVTHSKANTREGVMMFLNPNEKLFKIIFIHDPKLFVNNFNPEAFFSKSAYNYDE